MIAGRGARRPGPGLTVVARSDTGAVSLLAHDHVAGEGVALDDPLALSVDCLHPSAPAAVLALGAALHLQLELVAQVAAVRGVGELEAAPRGVGQQLDVAGDRLGGEVAA